MGNGMGVLEIVIISLIAIFFFTLTGISGISRILSWVLEKTLFNNIVEDDDGQEEEKNHRGKT